MHKVKEWIKRWIVKICMFISSYFPLYIMLLILKHDLFNTREKILNTQIFPFVLGMLICVIVSIISTIIIFKGEGVKSIKIKDLERPDDTIISYLMTYIIPLLANDYQKKEIIIVNIILFILIGYLYIRLNLIYLNPLWSVCGYFPYWINADVVVITDLKYSELKNIKETRQKLKGMYIANDIFIAKRKNNEL